MKIYYDQMRRISSQDQKLLDKCEMDAVEYSIYRNLLRNQRKYPQLTTKQYNLYKKLYNQILGKVKNTWLSKTKS